MKQFTQRVRHTRRALFYSQSIAIIAGLTLSVVLHELFHVITHWGHIQHIHFFTNQGALVAIDSSTTLGYDPFLEEVIAYAITLLVLLTTAAYSTNLHDRRDVKTFAQTILPKHSPLHKLSTKELLELATRTTFL